MKPCLQAASALLDDRPAIVVFEQRILDELIYDILVGSTVFPSAKQLLVEELSLVPRLIKFATQHSSAESFEMLRRIPEWKSIGSNSPLLLQLVGLVQSSKEARLSDAALTVLEELDRKFIATADLWLPIIQILGTDHLRVETGLRLLRLLSEAVSSCPPESHTRIPAASIVPLSSFALAHLSAASGPTMSLLERSSRRDGLEIHPKLVEFLTAVMKSTSSPLPPPQVAKEASESILTSLASLGLDDQRSSSSSASQGQQLRATRDRLGSHSNARIGAQRTSPLPRVTLGSARGRAGSAPTNGMEPPPSPTSLSSSGSTSARVDRQRELEEDFDVSDQGMRALSFLLRSLASRGEKMPDLIIKMSLKDLLTYSVPQDAATALVSPVYQYFGSESNAAVLIQMFQLFEVGPNLSQGIQQALVQFVDLCPAQFHQNFLNSSLVENIIIPASTFAPSGIVDDFVVGLLTALKRYGANAWRNLARFMTTVESFQVLCVFDQSPKIRACACQLFRSAFEPSIQLDLIDAGFLHFLASKLESEMKRLVPAQTPGSPGLSKDDIDALQRPVIDLICQIEERHFLSLTHMTVSPAAASAETQRNPSTPDLDLPREYSIVYTWLERIQNWRVVYRASRDGWSPDQFFQRCNACGPNLVIARAKGGAVFGGYTSQSWNPAHGGRPYVGDGDAFLFSISGGSSTGALSPVKLVVKPNKTSEAVYVSFSGVGPTYGEGHDLVIDLSAKKHRGNLGYTYNLPPGQRVVTSTFVQRVRSSLSIISHFSLFSLFHKILDLICGLNS